MTAVPTYSEAPSGPLCRLLRKMLAHPLSVRRVDGQLLADIGTHDVSADRVAQLVTRGLILASHGDDERTVYVLSDEGKKWAHDPTNGGER